MASKTLVDANVLLDIVTSDPTWRPWSLMALDSASEEGGLAINPIVFAEISTGFGTLEECDNAFPAERFERLDLPWSAAFAAGQVFVSYRRAGGTRRSPLPDFYIGAHATVEGMRLLTRDATRYRTYFPSLQLIAP